MELNDLKLLLHVARKGSFAATARDRELDPSLVSRAVARAEKHFNVRIFNRTTRRLSMTESGRHVLGRVQAIVEELEAVADEVQALEAEVSGALRLTTSTAFGQVCIVPLLRSFRNTFPNLRLQLILSDDNLDIVRENIDIAIRLAPSVEGDLICTKLHETRYHVCASPGYLASASPIRKPKDLIDHEVLQFDLPGYRSNWLFRDAKARMTEVPLRGNFTTTNAVALRDATRDGLGVSLLADWLVGDDIASGRLLDLFPKHRVTATDFDTAAWIIYPSKRFMPARVRATIDFLRSNLRN